MSSSSVPVPVKKRKASIVFSWGLMALVVIFIVIYFLPVEKRPMKAFFEDMKAPLVIAHQGGELLAPSNTMVAFEQAVELGVDVLEFDIHTTEDGHLVAIHDATVDRTTNGEGVVAELTLEEIQSFDAGYHFVDLNGENSYRGKDIIIPTVEEIFKKFPHMKMVIEIKDDNPSERIEEISENLWNLIQKYQMEDQVVITAFDQDIVETFKKVSNEGTAIAGGRQEIKKFVIYHTIFARNLYTPQVDTFQIPVSEAGIDLTKSSLVKGAHRRGIDVHYWTIDDKETMKKLINAGADGIITNRPDIMIELLEEMGLRTK
ncbi:glycerophosphodiester phosphodiesterase [Bacillus sp. 31A1R]|uniref:Glycerophosphodiester phosphodiesterase n=1 Tax=Robertmurraya mangrovi TaxID=3098077 RepID=A0ABU5J3V3_9BACI|nr:glycerophosphodiester phosphodiesterase [Bacillus sp. 31A1R]MDZ5474022.1 glycerophosphodiester phosphodiesterase [Bacillus sp. 31A1R]